jgi:hypothetical protein
MKVSEFIQDFSDKKIANSRINENAVSDYLKQTLEIKTYIPFREKRMIAEMIVSQNIKEVNGIKTYDSIDGYIGLIAASIATHTNIEWGEDPISEYDLLAEKGLLSQIIAEFQNSHNEIDILLKMTLASELEYNNVGNIIGRFLDGILNKLSGVEKIVAKAIENISEKDLDKLSVFLNKYIK